jgi:hypothetical protein
MLSLSELVRISPITDMSSPIACHLGTVGICPSANHVATAVASRGSARNARAMPGSSSPSSGLEIPKIAGREFASVSDEEHISTAQDVAARSFAAWTRISFTLPHRSGNVRMSL